MLVVVVLDLLLGTVWGFCNYLFIWRFTRESIGQIGNLGKFFCLCFCNLFGPVLFCQHFLLRGMPLKTILDVVRCILVEYGRRCMVALFVYVSQASDFPNRQVYVAKHVISHTLDAAHLF